MTIPEWADPVLTSDLPRLLRAGENQSVEFKQSIPKQSSDLANEIAAFASSNDGLILLGVSDDGKVVGVGIHGRRLMEISYYPLEFLSPSAANELREIGASLFLLETKTMYGDGGASQREAIATAAQILKRLNVLPFIAMGE